MSLSDCDGIPLSPEILEGCGFSPMSQEDKDDLGIEDTPLLVYNDSAICCYWDGVEYVFKYGLDSDLSIAACEFVHQLQNLIFALTGEELEVKGI